MNQPAAHPSSATGGIHDLVSGRSGAANVPRPKSRWLLRLGAPAAIVILTLLLLGWASWDQIMPAASVRVSPVIVKTVQGQAVGSVAVQAPGWVEPDPHPYYASALADGVVEDILVLEGSPVKAGDVVARMVDDDARLALEQAQASLNQRQADLASARADLTAAERNLEHLVERTQAVATAQARLGELAASLVKVDADVAAARAKQAEIEDELTRKRELLPTKAVSEAVIARLELQLESQMALIRSTEAQRDVLTAQRSRFQADLNAAQQNLELLIIETRQVDKARAAVSSAEGAVQLAAAKRDEAQLRFDRMSVRSPVDGVVMLRLASPGSKLQRAGGETSAHVVHIYDPARLQVRVDVPIADAASVGLDQLAEVIVDVLPDHVFTGKVTRVVHAADIAKNTVEVKVAIDEPHRATQARDARPSALPRHRRYVFPRR